MAEYDSKNAAADTQERVIPSTNSNASCEPTMWETIKGHPKVICYLGLTAVAPTMFGFDNIIVSVATAMPFFQMTYGSLANSSSEVTYIIPALWLGLWNALVQLGIMVGAAGNGFVIDRFGRRVGFILGGLVATASVGFIYMSPDVASIEGRRGVFLLGKTLLGVSLGILLSTSQTYVSEIAPTKLRGPLLASYTLFVAVGQLVAITIIFQRIAIFNIDSFKIPFAGQWAFAGIAVLAGVLIPESPVFYLQKNKPRAAKRVYMRLHSSSRNEQDFESLQRTWDSEMDAHTNYHASFKECFQGPDLGRTIIIILANILQQLLGITLISNSTYFLQLAGMSPSLSLKITQIGIATILIANVISWYTMTRFGRRFIMLASTFLVGLLWLSIGIAGCFKESTSLWYIGIGLMVITFFIQCGVGSAWPVVSAEASSVRLRTKSQSIVWIVNAFFSWLFNFIVPYLFDVDEANLGGKIGFFFAGLCVVAFGAIWFVIPEMKGRTYAQLDTMFERRIPVRQFRRYVLDEVPVGEIKEPSSWHKE